MARIRSVAATMIKGPQVAASKKEIQAKTVAKQLVVVASEVANQTEKLASKIADELLVSASDAALTATNKLSEAATVAADKLTSEAIEQLRIAAEQAATIIRVEASAEKKRMEEDVRSMIADVRQKVMSAGALNGSFETLMTKVETIEESQVKLVKNVDSIHEAIYNPDAGLFARINNAKVALGQENVKLEKELATTIAWRDASEKNNEAHVIEHKALAITIVDLDQNVKSLAKSRTTFYSAFRWIAAAIGGGLIVMLFRFLYDFIARLHVG